MATINLDNGVTLGYEIISKNKNMEKSAVFFHGIMAHKKNLQSFAKQFVNVFDGTGAIIFDLRSHGESSKNVSPYTISACARDIKEAITLLKVSPYCFVGHSFGVKVALKCAKMLKNPIENIWLLDASPSPQKFKMGDKTKIPESFLLIEILCNMNWPFKSRNAVKQELLKYGVSNKVANWMTTNLREVSDGVSLVFNPINIKKLLIDFYSVDLWPIVSSLSKKANIHLVRASRGGRIEASDQVLLGKYTDNKGFFHEIDASHFLHVDNPKALLDLMVAHMMGSRYDLCFDNC